ncbi:hypothetical protein TWF788_006165 [Orbilia oligospora]|uniref:Uncharacterized protein n=1 Tax=Orbilia oligospora TaxID=2813651 RepID=A0A7C8Q3E8_ORBOL|nr:hypothetical protein TWF788_006165 [Orbilia oligospora]
MPPRIVTQQDLVSGKRKACFSNTAEAPASKRPVPECYLRDERTLSLTFPSGKVTAETADRQLKTVEESSTETDAMKADSGSDMISPAIFSMVPDSGTSVSDTYSFESGTTEPIVSIYEQNFQEELRDKVPTNASHTQVFQNINQDSTIDASLRIQRRIRDFEEYHREDETNIQNISSMIMPFHELARDIGDLEPMFQIGLLLGTLTQPRAFCRDKNEYIPKHGTY